MKTKKNKKKTNRRKHKKNCKIVEKSLIRELISHKF